MIQERWENLKGKSDFQVLPVKKKNAPSPKLTHMPTLKKISNFEWNVQKLEKGYLAEIKYKKWPESLSKIKEKSGFVQNGKITKTTLWNF